MSAPAPGTVEARSGGCTCSLVLGLVDLDDGLVAIYRPDCPIHWPEIAGIVARLKAEAVKAGR